MNKLKAPKDGTPEEFVAEFEKRHGRPYDCAMTAIINTMKEMLAEPAPNPFTPDQLVVLRELQRSGFNYAATDASKEVFLYENEPEMDEDGYWDVDNVGGDYVESPFAFLTEVLSTDDKFPLCFADYAPPEERET